MKGIDYDSLIDNSGRIFMALGYVHPPQRTRAQLIYVPTPDQEEKGYMKVIYDPAYPTVAVPSTYYYSQYGPDDRILAIPDEEVVRVYQPRLTLERRMKDLPDGIIDFIHLLIELAGIPLTSIGIFGSWLVGLEHENSDIDIVIFGRHNHQKYWRYLDDLVLAAHLSPLSSDSIQKRAQEFCHRLKLPLSNVLDVLNQRRTKYAAGKTPVSISFSLEADEAPSIDVGRPKESINLLGVVTDDSGAPFTPRIYQVASANITYIVIAYPYFFKEVASTGEKVHVHGTLREDDVITVENPGEFILPSED